MNTSTHPHAATGQPVTVKVDPGTVRRATDEEERVRKAGQLPALIARRLDAIGRRS